MDWRKLPRRAHIRAVRIVVTPARAARGTWYAVVDQFNALGLSENAILLGFGVAVGLAGAFGVVAFYKLIDLAFGVFYRWPATFISRTAFLAYRPLITAAGFVTAWWVMRRLGRGHEGLNVPDVQRAVARRGGDVPTTPALARTAASAITIGSGGSAGSEGPVAVLGAAAGSLLGRLFRFEGNRVKVLVGAGAAAGISAAFNAPLAGAFFALEEILGSFTASAFPAVVVSSVIAAVVSRAFFGNHPAFPIPAEYGYTLLRELLLFYPILGVLAGLASALFVWTYFRTDEWVRRLPLSPYVVPMVGGGAGGCPGVPLRRHPGGLRPPGGASRGVRPDGLVGASAAGAGQDRGDLAHPEHRRLRRRLHPFALHRGRHRWIVRGGDLPALFPTLHLHPEAFALVGMGAVVAGATDAPITGILLVFEMTNDYAIVLPLMLATVISHYVARRLEPDSLYSGWLRRRGENLEHGTDRDVLNSLTVADALPERAGGVRPQRFGDPDAGSARLRRAVHLSRGGRRRHPARRGDHRAAGPDRPGSARSGAGADRGGRGGLHRDGDAGRRPARSNPEAWGAGSRGAAGGAAGEQPAAGTGDSLPYPGTLREDAQRRRRSRGYGPG